MLKVVVTSSLTDKGFIKLSLLLPTIIVIFNF